MPADEHAAVGHQDRGVVVGARAVLGGHRLPRLRARIETLRDDDRDVESGENDAVTIGAREHHDRLVRQHDTRAVPAWPVQLAREPSDVRHRSARNIDAVDATEIRREVRSRARRGIGAEHAAGRQELGLRIVAARIGLERQHHGRRRAAETAADHRVDHLRIDRIAEQGAELAREILRTLHDRADEATESPEKARGQVGIRRVQSGRELREADLVQLQRIAGDREVGPLLRRRIVGADDVP